MDAVATAYRSSDLADASDPAMPDGRFAIGQPVSRKEDPILVRGEGHYTDDLSLPGQLYGVAVRSRVAHGILRAVRIDEALALPGVRAIYRAADLVEAGIGLMPAASAENRDGTPAPKPPQMALATDKVRYVGHPIAFVVADSQAAAKDAAEAVIAEIDQLPAVVTPQEAVAAGAPQIYDEAPGNLFLDYHYGDSAAVVAAFARAAHVTRLAIRNSRVVVSAMEPRSAIASFEAESGRYELRLGCQGVFGMRNNVASVMKIPTDKLRVLTGNVGGSFGMKASVYPEYVCLLHATRQLGLPVKWTDERSDSFISDSHGRDHDMVCELALDAEGHFLALRVEGFGNLGACLSNATVIPPTFNTVKNIIGVYRTPLVEVSSRCVFTNTVPVGAYRGAGRPEGNYYMERLVETAAREMGIDRVELRRRNQIAPEQMPYKAPSGMVYDSGDFPAVLEEGLQVADWGGFEARRQASAARGRVRGRGIGHYLEVTAPPGNEMAGIRFDDDGGVTLIAGTLDYGQGHATPFAQVLQQKLGIPFERIRLVQGDSDQLIAGGGTGGSRSIMQNGSAIVEAGDLVIEKARKLAAHLLEAAEVDLEFGGGRFAVRGTDLGIHILDLAARLRQGGLALPEGMPESLDVRHVFKGAPAAFPNGCHVAEVELDPETGVVEVVSYQTVNDFGVLVNPMLVAGQAHGGIAQGIGQALTEQVVYDENGQLLSGSYMDYALPRADQVPDIGFGSHPVPARTNALGVKGCGEAGCAGSLPAVMNAVVDALQPFGIDHIDMPATPLKVWQAIQEAKGRA